MANMDLAACTLLRGRAIPERSSRILYFSWHVSLCVAAKCEAHSHGCEIA